jgi:hypothetical protein
MTEVQQKMSSHISGSIETSEEDMLRTKRRGKIIDDMVEKLQGAVQKYIVQTEALCIENEELKATRESIKSDLQQTLSQEFGRLTPKLTQDLKSLIHLQMTDSLKTNVELLQRTQREADLASSSIQTLSNKNRKGIAYQGLALVAASCFSCIVTASCVFYFFPQQQYVRYEMTAEQAKQMLIGKSVLSNFKKLNQDAQKLLVDGIETDIKKMEGKQ